MKTLHRLCSAIQCGIDERITVQTNKAFDNVFVRRYHLVTAAGSYDYSKPFKLFDESGDGTIPMEEFRGMLCKLNIDALLREGQVVQLMNRFDTDRTGVHRLEQAHRAFCLCVHVTTISPYS